MRVSQVLASSLVAVATMLTASPVSAQGDGGVGFGLEAGITRASITAEGAKDFFNSRSGIMGGIWFGGNRNGPAGLMGELTYVVKGANDKFTDDALKLHYIEIPLLIRFNLGQTSTKNGFLVYPMFGPVADINIKADDAGLDVKDQINGFDFGAMAGVGVELARIGIEGRMNWGLKRITKEADAFGPLVDVKNNTVQVVVKIRAN